MQARILMLSLALVGIAAPSQASSWTPPIRVVFPVSGTVPCGSPWSGDSTCPNDTVPRMLGSRVCSDPLPSNSVSTDVRTEPAPVAPEGETTYLVFHLYPTVAWDGFICDDGNELATASFRLGETCDTFLGSISPFPVGCVREASVAAVPAHRYSLRAINRSDYSDCAGDYSWVFT